MKTKIFYLLLLCLMVLGRGEVWAATETYNLVGNTDNSTINTASGTTSFGTSMGAFYATSSVQLTVGGGSDYWTLAADRITGKNDNCSITLQASKAGTLTIYLRKNSGSNKYLTINDNLQIISVTNGGSTSYPYAERTGYKGYNTDGITNLVVTIAATGNTAYTLSFSHSDFSNWSFTGFKFTETAPDIVSMEVNINDMYYSIPNTTIGKYVGTSFSYDLTNTAGEGNTSNAATSLRIKMDLGANLDNSFKTTDYFSVTSSNSSVINVSSYTVGRVGDYANKVYYYVNVGGAGEAVLTFTYHGPNGDLTCNKQFTIFRIPMYWGNKDNPSYPFTWDFTRDWTGSFIQASKNTTNWISTAYESRLNGGTETGGTLVGWSGIDMITGLDAEVSTYPSGDNIYGSFCLDWTNRQIWMNGTLKIPNLYKGHKVTFTTKGETTISATESGNVSGSGTTFTMTSDGTLSGETYTSPTSFTVNGYLESIKVEKSNLSDFRRGGSSSDHLKDNSTMNLNDNTRTGVFYIVHGNQITTNDISVTCNNSNVTCGTLKPKSNDANNTESFFTITANSIGTSTITISYPGSHGLNPATITLNINVIRSATPKKWDFENASYWSTTSVNLNSSYWVTSSDATNNPGEVMSNVAFNNTELTKDGTNKIPEMEGLVMTAVKGSSRFNIGQYYRLGNYSKASITIPSLTTGQTVTFKVGTATSGKERGITATSSNLELISGQVSDKVSYFTYRVTSDGDGVFHQTSEDAGLKIYYIDLKAATPAATELKFVDGSGNDISNKQVNIESSTTGALDSYFQLSKSLGTAWNDVTVTVSSSSLLTYDNDGTFTMGSGTGTATITARTESSSTETGIAVLYVSVKAQPTVRLSANGPFSVNYGHDFNNNTSTVTGTPMMGETTISGLTVKYKSSNERVATVNSSGVVTCVGVGTATITAYTEETNTYLPAEASYQVTYNAGNVVFAFVPDEIDLPLGLTITPYMHYDQKGQIDATDLTFTASASGVVTTEDVVSPRESDKHLCKITSVNDASKVGESVIITARGKVKGSDPVTYYYTTIKVNITAEDACNFNWENSSDIYIYEDTYLPIPKISGNATGNNHFSNSYKNGGNGDASGNNNITVTGNNYLYYWEGENHYDPLHAYVYEIKNNVITWNNMSKENTHYHLNEGYPDFYLTDESNNTTDKGYILWARSSNKAYGDTLLIYGKTEGTIKLHAKDSQNGTECSPLTIHIMPKSTIYGGNGELVSQTNTISFPYTWDFTNDVDLSALDNSVYWDKEDGVYCNAPLTANLNFADGAGTHNTSTKTSLAILGYTSSGDHHILPLFKGMKIQLGNSTYDSKIHKIRLRPYSAGTPRLYLNGGTHTFTMPRPGYNNPNTGFYEPETYQIIIKLKFTNNTEVEIGTNGAKDIYKSVSKNDKDHTQIADNSVQILRKTVNSGENVTLGLADAYVYWIAFSTEAKPVTKPDNTTYPAATYSYQEALDIDKSEEANTGLTTYYARSFTGSNVVMTRITGKVERGTNSGLMLKLPESTVGTSTSCYMIADPKNTETYSAPNRFPNNESNLLKSTGTGMTIYRFGGDGDYTNFVLTNQYIDVDDNDPNFGKVGEGGGQNWGFVRVNGSIEAPANMAYLILGGRQGNIGTTIDENDASRSMYGIVFEDDSELTGIKNLHDSKILADEDAWYTLQGVRVTTPSRGRMYIHKGKKVFLK